MHPDAGLRRDLLADTDGLFACDWVVAFTTGVAAGTALATLQDVGYLTSPGAAAIVVPALVLAVPIAGIVCVQCWRVGLRDTVRGQRHPLGWPVGLGLGVGLAVAPVLTLQAAVGSFADGLDGWVGYLVWGLLLVAGTVLIVRWVADSSRLRVATTLPAASPTRAFAVHVALTTALIALLLSIAAVMLPLLTAQGASVLGSGQPWLRLPEAIGWSWLGFVGAADRGSCGGRRTG